MAKSEKAKVAFTITNTADGKKIQDAITEISNHKFQIDSHNQAIKDIRQRMVEETGIEPKFFNQLVSLYIKDNCAEVEASTEELIETYNAIFK